MEVRCLYASISGSGWRPSSDTEQIFRSEIDRALHGGSITLREEDNRTGFIANMAHPSYAKLAEAIEELDHFISEEASSELLERLERETETFIGLKFQDYWEEALYEQRLLD